MRATLISKDGTPLAYHHSGAGPPLVLVHGAGNTSARWEPILPALGQHFSLYALDRRGRGESRDTAPYALEREFEDVAALVEAIEPPVCVLGHSLGAICALEAALLTAHIRQLVLYEPPLPLPGVPLYPAGILDRLESLREVGDREGILTVFLQEVVRMPSPEFAFLKASAAWPVRLAVAPALPRELRAHAQYRFEADRFKGLAIPVLLLLGENSPSFFKAAIEVLKTTLPTSRVVVLPGQQHAAMDTAPDLFTREVLAFLQQPG